MVIIETEVFTRRIKDLMREDDYRELQDALVLAPDTGDVYAIAVEFVKFDGWRRATANAAELG